MRRGHQGSVWRNENPRNFRPRGGGPMHFRTPRNYNQLESPRFHPPNQRAFVRPPFYKHSSNNDTYKPVDQGERDNYRHNVQHMPTERHRPPGQRLILPYIRQSWNPNNKDHPQHYKDNFYEESQNNNFQVNRMGNVDFRHPNKNMIKQPLLSVWNEPQFHNIKQPEKPMSSQSYDRPYRRESCETNKLPATDFGGHRPHSSDYYGSNPVPDIDNSNSFSHSVDDTVDIIRKRLQNRNDPQYNQQSENEEVNQETTQPAAESSFRANQQEAPRKRIQRQKQNAKENCDKIKNKIVHQLFKMDKDTIHKLMDNPNSSSKFEYAISSLITESQNSYNRHLRSAAEKSLCQSSTEFIHNDNNTVYEDTFIKQMQCILDPQDTVLLEDIKPLVLAELSKVLQLDQFEQLMEPPNNYNAYFNFDEHYSQFENDPNNDSTSDIKFDVDSLPENTFDNYAESNADTNNVRDMDINASFDIKPIFERRTRQDSSTDYNRNSLERSNEHRRSVDTSNERCESVPLFDSNTVEQLSDDDPFAELDKQYHVAVDHNFIEGDYDSPQHSSIVEPPNSPIFSRRYLTPTAESKTSTKSRFRETNQPSKVQINSARDQSNNHFKTSNQVKQEYEKVKYSETVCSTTSTITSQNQEFVSGNQSRYSENENHVSSSTMKSTNLSSNSRKRSTDQKPSHRKEKRKKSESHQEESQIFHVSDCKIAIAKHDSGKTTLHSYFPKDKLGEEIAKDTKEIETSHKEYSDKYVKRKETPKKTKETEQKKKVIVNSANHSMLSPTEKDSSSNVSQTLIKLDSKTKLKTFNMFEAQPRKSSVSHQALRNTAAATVVCQVYTNKSKSAEPSQKSKTTQTQTPKLKPKETQTIVSKIKTLAKSVQTDPVSFSATKPKPTKASDAYERMKEIDMEIQNLLQEKFKLYNSLDSKDGIPTSMPALGMTVVSVEETKDDNDSLCEDTIVDDFTSIPVEELEQIALETVKEPSPAKSTKKTQKQKVMAKERKTSESPTLTKRGRKAKSPSISLIEQIITDERPLEDIIELDVLEESTPKTKRRAQSRKKTVKKTLTKSLNKVPINYEIKNCSVVLLREDLNKYLTKLKKISNSIVPPKPVLIEPENLSCEVVLQEDTNESETVIEETIVNDLQIDMLDVSEDIIIGDMCEIKLTDDKDSSGQLGNVSEEIILDNSQSSIEEIATHETNQNSTECKTFDYSADENLRRDSVLVSGNADSVLAIECVDNNFLAACLDGNVYYFSGTGQLLNTLRGSNLAVTCLTIVKEKYGTTVYTGSLDSRIRYYDLETGLEKGPECNVLSPIQTMDRAWDTVFVGTRTGFVLQFECKNNMLIPVSTVKFSDQSILALRALKEGPRKVLLVAARSENVTIKDAQTGLLLRTLLGPKMTVYTLLFEDGKVYCGTSSHQIHVFDYSSGSHLGLHSGGKGAVCLRYCGGLLFAGCYDGCVYVYRQGVNEPVAQLRGPSLMLLSLAVHGSKIIAGYKDRSLYIWKIPLAVLQEMIL